MKSWLGLSTVTLTLLAAACGAAGDESATTTNADTTTPATSPEYEAFTTRADAEAFITAHVNDIFPDTARLAGDDPAVRAPRPARQAVVGRRGRSCALGRQRCADRPLRRHARPSREGAHAHERRQLQGDSRIHSGRASRRLRDDGLGVGRHRPRADEDALRRTPSPTRVYRAECDAILASGAVAPYKLSDPHHGNCYRRFHVSAFNAYLAAGGVGVVIPNIPPPAATTAAVRRQALAVRCEGRRGRTARSDRPISENAGG